ncbi:unnamed protein product [Haemonchus placei]|uniref:Uncharacterized protein n=1 Tax=Haemonchus placei TaxID=6290 RepID=A0A0N4XAI5_HAEPC|nr:unnamed protein product [Haemonchus placei]
MAPMTVTPVRLRHRCESFPSLNRFLIKLHNPIN